MHIFFHKWTKWEQYDWHGIETRDFLGRQNNPPIEFTTRRQKRHCEECGKEQDELVRNG